MYQQKERERERERDMTSDTKRHDIYRQEGWSFLITERWFSDGRFGVEGGRVIPRVGFDLICCFLHLLGGGFDFNGIGGSGGVRGYGF